jgi:hypothetical protein
LGVRRYRFFWGFLIMTKKFLDAFCVVFLAVFTIYMVDWFVTLLAE